MERPILIMNSRRNSVRWSGRSERLREKLKQQKVLAAMHRICRINCVVRWQIIKVFLRAAGLKERDNRLRVESGSSTLKSTKAYQNAVNMKNAGAFSNKTDPFGRKREKHAISYYEEIRNRRSDYVIKRISKNGGVSEKAAKNIYEHVFVEKHIFADGTERQFDPDYDMSESFRRILEGKNIKPHDITMLRHENLELNLMKKYNMVHEDAHSLAEQKYNYKKELDEFLERIGG